MDLGLWRGVRGYAHAFTCRVAVCTYSQMGYDLRSEIPGFQSSTFIYGQPLPCVDPLYRGGSEGHHILKRWNPGGRQYEIVVDVHRVIEGKIPGQAFSEGRVARDERHWQFCSEC